MPEQFTYSPNAVIQIPSVINYESGLSMEVLTNAQKIPMNSSFFVVVKLPLVDPTNLLPLNQPNFAPPVTLSYVQAASDAGVAYNTRVVVGRPVTILRRNERRQPAEFVHQFFQFPPLGITDAALLVSLWLRSQHKFFDSVISFAARRAIMKKKDNLQVIA